MIPLYFWLTLALGIFIGVALTMIGIGRALGIRCADFRYALMRLVTALKTGTSYQDALEYALKVLED